MSTATERALDCRWQRGDKTGRGTFFPALIKGNSQLEAVVRLLGDYRMTVLRMENQAGDTIEWRWGDEVDPATGTTR